MRLIEELARIRVKETAGDMPSRFYELKNGDLHPVYFSGIYSTLKALNSLGLLTSQAIDRLIEDGDWPLKEE